jgi:hypothetical protein
LGKVESQGFGGAPESKTRTVSIWKEPCCSVPKTGSNTTSPGCSSASVSSQAHVVYRVMRRGFSVAFGGDGLDFDTVVLR